MCYLFTFLKGWYISGSHNNDGLFTVDSTDVDNLKKLILHNPFILTLPEVENVKDDIIPKNVEQFWVIIPACPSSTLKLIPWF